MRLLMLKLNDVVESCRWLKFGSWQLDVGWIAGYLGHEGQQ
jgi:hypothetical protein